MRQAISTDENSGSSRFQTEAPAQSYLELLQADDAEVKHVTTVSWKQAQQLKLKSK